MPRPTSPLSAADDSSPSASSTSTPLPETGVNKVFDYFYRVVVISISLYALYELNFYHVIMYSPRIWHSSLVLSVCSSILLLTVKIYLENIRGTLYKDKITYENHPQATHLGLILLIITSVSFILALKTKYGIVGAVLLSCVVGYGILFNVMQVVRSNTVQNVAAIAGATFFLQVYLGFGKL